MTVNELIDALEKLDGDMPIAVSRDSEGNGFSPLYQISLEDMEKQDIMGRFLDFSQTDKAEQYVTFWPTH